MIPATLRSAPLPKTVRAYLLPYEQEIIALYPHPGGLVNGFTLGLTSVLVALLFGLGFLPDSNVIPLLAATVTAVILMIHFLIRLLAWVASYIVVTQIRLIFVGDLFGKAKVVPLAQISDLTFHRSFSGRLFGYGLFVFELKGQGQSKLKINYVPYPEQVYVELAELIFPPEDEFDE